MTSASMHSSGRAPFSDLLTNGSLSSCMFTALSIVLEHDKYGTVQALRES